MYLRRKITNLVRIVKLVNREYEIQFWFYYQKSVIYVHAHTYFPVKQYFTVAKIENNKKILYKNHCPKIKGGRRFDYRTIIFFFFFSDFPYSCKVESIVYLQRTSFNRGKNVLRSRESKKSSFFQKSICIFVIGFLANQTNR